MKSWSFCVHSKMLRSLQTSRNSTSTLSCLLDPAVALRKGTPHTHTHTHTHTLVCPVRRLSPCNHAGLSQPERLSSVTRLTAPLTQTSSFIASLVPSLLLALPLPLALHL